MSSWASIYGPQPQIKQPSLLNKIRAQTQKLRTYAQQWQPPTQSSWFQKKPSQPTSTWTGPTGWHISRTNPSYFAGGKKEKEKKIKKTK